MVKQYCFYFDVERCIQCRTCEVACVSIHNIEPGIKWRKVIEIWSGEFPDVTRTFVSMSCLHCAKPACEEACPTKAISKRAEDGIVMVDKDECTGCQDCYAACPYDVPQFGSDSIMQKCDFCLERGIEPACVAHCPTGALNYCTIDELPKLPAGKVASKLAGSTEPSMIILHKPGIDDLPPIAMPPVNS